MIQIAKKEGKELDEEVAQRLAIVADGSGRKALVLLHAILGLSSVEQQIAAIDSNDSKGEAIRICQLLFKKGSTWKEMAAVLANVGEEPESLRYMILGYCTSILLKGADNPRAIQIIEEFRDNFYDSKKAGLVACCYNMIKEH